MCILKIHANSHSANAIQSAAHNMDTNISDLDTLRRMMEVRGHDVAQINLAMWHVQKAQTLAWSYWQEFVNASPTIDTPPIGAENMEVTHNEYGAYFQHGDGRVSSHDVPTSFYGLSVEDTRR